MAQVIRYVDPDAVGAGNGQSWADAYNSLQAWDTGEATNLITDGDTHTVYCKSSGGTADTTECVIGGWTTDATHYIEIIQDDFPADGVFDATKYHIYLNPSSGTHECLTIQVDYVRIHGLQLHMEADSSAAGMLLYYPVISASNDLRVDSLIGLMDGNSSAANCYGIYLADTSINIKIYNTIVWDNSGPGDIGILCASSNVVDIYNCDVFGWSTYGIRRGANGGTVSCYNCAVGDNGDDFSGTFNTIDNCISDDGDGDDPQTPSGGDWANEFTDPGSGDFSLKAGGNCVDNGTDDPGSGLFSDDITGAGDRQSPWDISAFDNDLGGGGNGGNGGGEEETATSHLFLIGSEF